MSLSRRLSTGAGWLISARLITRALDFAALMVLARLLSPSDFGLVAIGTTFITVAEAVLELPVGAVLLRDGSFSREFLDTAFTLSLLRGVALALTVIVIAIPVSQIYHDPRLLSIMALLVAAPILRGLQSPALIRFAASLRFGRAFSVEIIGKAVGLTSALVVARVYHSYLALVVNTVVTPCAMVIVSFVLAPSRPSISLSRWRTFSGFLAWTTASQALTAISWQCDRLLLGLFVPHSLLGRFTLASDLAAVPDQAAIKPLATPLLSAFTSVKADPERLRSAYVQASTAVVTAGLPLMVGLSLFAHPLVHVLLGGGRWEAAAPLLRWIALASTISLFAAPLSALAMALGETRIFVERSVAEIIVQLPTVAVAAAFFGVPGVILAKAIVGLYMFAVATLLVRRLIGLSVVAQVRCTWRPVVGAGSMVFVGWLCGFGETRSPSAVAAFATLSASSVVMTLAYSITVYICWMLAGRPKGLEQSLIDRLRLRQPKSPPVQ